MKIYTGKKVGFDHKVTVLEGNVLSDLSPEPSQDIVNHSPDGFNWGYSGSGPAQLALGLLLDVTGDKDISSRYYQLFKSDVISQLDDEWEINEAAIQE